MSAASERAHLRRQLEAHLTKLGYSSVRPRRAGRVEPEIVRVSPVRGRIVYGEIVLPADLKSKTCHERLVTFSQRQTRQRSSILFFIGVPTEDQAELESLLEQLSIRDGLRGGHVHVIPIAAQETPNARRRAVRAEAKTSAVRAEAKPPAARAEAKTPAARKVDRR